MQLYRIYTNFAEKNGIDVACRKTFKDTLGTETYLYLNQRKTNVILVVLIKLVIFQKKIYISYILEKYCQKRKGE